MKRRNQHAERDEGREDVRSDEARGNGQGEGGADRTIENGAGAGDGKTTEIVSAGAREAPPKQAYLNVTEDGMKAALIEARGDIFIASQLLGITAIRLNRAIQVSPLLQATVDTIPKVHTGLSKESLNEAIESRLAIYRVAGLDALHDLATMPIDVNSAQNQVKLAAAARLAGSPEAGGAGGEVGEALRSLNQLYQEHAPRLRVVRERLTVEVSPGERDITPQDDQQ
jgi:hypothetical protein